MARRVAYWTAVVLLLVATVVVSVAVSGGGDERAPATTAPRTAPAQSGRNANANADADAGPRTILLVRRRTGLPPSWVARLRRSRAVDALAEVARTQWLLRRSERKTGHVVDAPRAGYAIPLDVAVVDPRAYARVTAAPAFKSLRRGRVLLSRSSARLRELDTGDRLTLTGGRTVTVAGVVDDGLARDAELVAAAADVPRAERRSVQLTLATSDPGRVADLVPDDRLTRVQAIGPGVGGNASASRGQIIRPVAVKLAFGEFAVKLPYGADWIGIDPAWQRRNIVTRSVPILGPVTCHRRLITPLRRALATLQRRGLSRLVDRGDYAGCQAPRRIPGSGSLSLHAWGLAVDINASANPQGSKPRQDPRVVAAFEDEGFTWGGRWPTAPDGMHFELHRLTSTSARSR